MSIHQDAEIALKALADEDFVENGGHAWVRLIPEVVEDLGSSKQLLLDAVEAFESTEWEAGREAAAWLRDRALDEYGSSITYLMLRKGEVEAFYALCSAEVLLTGRDRTKLFRSSRAKSHEVSRRQPASLIAWAAKRTDGEEKCGALIMGHALATAWEVAELQGNIALVLDPYDERTADMWLGMDFLTFRRSANPQKDDSDEDSEPLLRLWTPLHPADDSFT
jgi:hypothetical protein